MDQDPKNIQGLVYKGSLELLKKKSIDAEKTFKKIIELAPANPLGYSKLGLLYFFKKQYENALEQFATALKLQPGLAEALIHSVLIYLEKKQFDTALIFCDQQSHGLKKNSASHALIYYLKGKIYVANNRSAQAKNSFEKAIQINPDTLSPYLALAKMYIKEKNTDSAIYKYEDILAKRPFHLPAYMSLGTIYQQKGDIKKAELYYRKALEIKRDFAPVANNLALLLADHGGSVDEALDLAQIAKEKMPENPSTLDTLGWVYYKKGLYRSAIIELEQSYEKTQTNPVVLYHLGMAYLKNGQKNQAKDVLEKALKLNIKFPGYEQAQETLVLLQG